MSKHMWDDRYISIVDSLTNACKEVKQIREGIKPEQSLDALWELIAQWRSEDSQ